MMFDTIWRDAINSLPRAAINPDIFYDYILWVPLSKNATGKVSDKMFLIGGRGRRMELLDISPVTRGDLVRGWMGSACHITFAPGNTTMAYIPECGKIRITNNPRLKFEDVKGKKVAQ